MARLRSIASDLDLETGGRWLDWRCGIRLLVARWGNRTFNDALEELRAPHIEAIREGTLDEETKEKILAGAMARGILKGWENVEDDDDQPMPYTVEEGERVLLAPEFHDLREDVMTYSMDAEKYRARAQEEAAGN